MTSPSVLFILGSPRAYGNCMALAEDLVSRATAAGCVCTVAAPLKNLPFEEVRPAFTSTLSIEGCRACGGCSKSGVCVIDDTMRSISVALERVDAVVWITPVYFGSVPAQLKAVIDRTQPFFARRRLGLVDVGVSRKPVLAYVLGSGEDPFGAEAALVPLESASHMFEGNIIDKLVITGVDRAGEMNDDAHEDIRAVADKKLDTLIEAARAFAASRDEK